MQRRKISDDITTEGPQESERQTSFLASPDQGRSLCNKLTRKSFTNGTKIGSGAFGTVYKVQFVDQEIEKIITGKNSVDSNFKV